MLTEKLNSLQEYRKDLSRVDIKAISLVCYDTDIEEAVNVIKNFHNKTIERICVPSSIKRTNNLTNFDNIPVEELEKNFDKTNLTVFAKDFFTSQKWKYLLDTVWINTFREFYYFNPTFIKEGTPVEWIPLPDFYNENKDKIDRCYNLFATEKDKEEYLRSIKSIIEGSSGYLYWNGDEEYFPAKLMPVVKKGDVVADVGVSSYYPELEKYSVMAGTKGKVLAFEASPVEYEKIKQDLAKRTDLKNVELINYGLWNYDTTLKLSVDETASSLIFQWTDNLMDCKLVTLDNYMKSHKIKKLDYIKMDIEGAESQALAGAEKTIKKHRPNMAICVYHHPVHLYELMLYIDSLNAGYDFYFQHHSAYGVETVLYAVRKNCFKFCYEKITRLFNLDKLINNLKIKFDRIRYRYKRILVYGAGSNFEKLYKENYFKNWHITAISDKKFTETAAIHGIMAVAPEQIFDLDFDAIFITLKQRDKAVDFIKKLDEVKSKNIKFLYEDLK